MNLHEADQLFRRPSSYILRSHQSVRQVPRATLVFFKLSSSRSFTGASCASSGVRLLRLDTSQRSACCIWKAVLQPMPTGSVERAA